MDFPSSPVTATHAILGMIPEPNTYTLDFPDEGMALIAPVYNEEDFIYETLDAAIISQTSPPDQVIISENGSNDRTLDAIQFFLAVNDYRKINSQDDVERYEAPGQGPILIKINRRQTSKAEGVNTSVPLVDQKWALVIDSDTVLHPEYILHMKANRYRIHLGNGEATIVKANNLGGTVLTKLRKDAGVTEQLISMAREAEYTAGQLVIRPGQNKTAMYVTPGCGIVCETSLLHFPDRTVTEDLEMTLDIQLKRAKRRLSPEEVDSLMKQKITVGCSPPKTLDELISGTEAVHLLENTARYVPKAMMFTQDPTNMKGFLNQIDRWIRGGHQVRLLRRNEIIKNPRVAFTMYGGFIEGFLNAALFIGLPAAGVAFAATGVGLPLSALALTYTVDFGLQSGMVGLGMFKRGRQYGLGLDESVGYSVLNTPLNTAVLYGSRMINSFMFIRTYAETFKQVIFDKRESWASSWVRPHAKSPKNKGLAAQLMSGLSDQKERLKLRSVLAAYESFTGQAGQATECNRVYRDVFNADNKSMTNLLSDQLFKRYYSQSMRLLPGQLIRTDVLEYMHVLNDCFKGDKSALNSFMDLVDAKKLATPYERIQAAHEARDNR